MEVDYIARGQGKDQGDGQAAKPELRVRKERSLRTRLLVKKPPRQNIKEVEGAKVDADPAEEFVFTIGKHSQRCNLGPQWLRKSEKTEWR